MSPPNAFAVSAIVEAGLGLAWQRLGLLLFGQFQSLSDHRPNLVRTSGPSQLLQGFEDRPDVLHELWCAWNGVSHVNVSILGGSPTLRMSRGGLARPLYNIPPPSAPCAC